MATYSEILTWNIVWTEDPRGLWLMDGGAWWATGDGVTKSWT